MLLADRFLRVRDAWFDIATGLQVEVTIRSAASRHAQLAWADRCAMLARLRHPLLNPLVDYGVAGSASLFEAHMVLPSVIVRPACAPRMVRHACRFLQAHGITLDAGAARLTFRAVLASATARRCRPVGLVLQPRSADDEVGELAGAALPGGATCVRIASPPGAGLRTFISAAARIARCAGYVPVCPGALVRWPSLFDELAQRHVFILSSADPPAFESAALVRLLARVGLHSTRAHICLTFDRGLPRATDCRLEPMGIRAMTTMTYVDPEYGPSAAEILAAARRSDGLPGRFLSELGVRPLEATPSRSSTVHEARPEYVAGPPGAMAPALRRPGSKRRLGGSLDRAPGRARTLEAQGRHAAASRLLLRAARVLHGRGEVAAAARCWLQLGWLARRRALTERALAHAERARAASTDAAVATEAGCLTAVCWTDQARLPQAEAALRALDAAARATGAASQTDPGRARIGCALARVLYWQGRHAEAADHLRPLTTHADPSVSSEALARLSRSLAALGDLSGALNAAREANRRAAGAADVTLRLAGERAMTEALLAAGDIEGVRAHAACGLEAAAAAKRPLTVLHLRAMLLRALGRSGGTEPGSARVEAALTRALRRPIPALLRQTIEAARQTTIPQGGHGLCLPATSPGHVEAFLEIAQRSPDDETAVAEVAATLCERVGAVSVAVLTASDTRVIAAAGRPWRDKSAAAVQALSTGRSAGLDDPRQPREAAEPVRCGGELVGAIACRWVLGAVAIPGPIGIALRGASLAIASHVRALADRVPAEPPPSVWGDLLGDSAVAVALREAVMRASRAPFPVLIEGESGSGKELVARAIHRLSPRHTRRFCAINCAALSDELIEAELFGHSRGAFTGALTERAGLFEEADGGTLFLDEVGELAARAQAKLLRVLQEGEVRRVGENLPRRVDVRIVSATNRRLEQEASHGRFRTDLRFRLDVLRINVPPLRERVDDIPILAQHFWRQACSRVGTSATLGPDTLAALSRHDWPGNVRELQNAIAWMAVHAPRRGRVSPAMLPAQLAARTPATGSSFEAAREDFERRFVRAALAQAGGQRQIAAKALGISRQGLAKMMRRLGIDGASA